MLLFAFVALIPSSRIKGFSASGALSPRRAIPRLGSDEMGIHAPAGTFVATQKALRPHQRAIRRETLHRLRREVGEYEHRAVHEEFQTSRWHDARGLSQPRPPRQRSATPPRN